MKSKVKAILLIFVLVFGFMYNVNAETKIKEDASSYSGDIYIIGSSKFDSNIIITSTMTSVAGAREAYVQYMVHNNIGFNPDDVKVYYYSELAESWSILPATSDEEIKELTEIETEELVQNLNIYFVNNEEKILEVPYEVAVEEGYEMQFTTNNETYDERIKYESGKLIIPATVTKVNVFATKSETEGEVSEKILMGTVEQIDGEFENTKNVVRTYEELVSELEKGTQCIQIDADIDLPTALEITSKVEIYLNNANLTVKEDTEGNGVFHVLEGGDLTIDGDGIIDGVGKNKWNLVIFAEAGKVTINGGTYTNVNTQVLEEDSDSDHFDVIYAKGTAQIEINGGTFEGITPEWLLNISDSFRETASITVKGGTFKGFNPANNASEGAGTSFLAEGYNVVSTDDGYRVLVNDENDVVMSDGFTYQSLQDAILNVASGATIKLIQDIDLPTAVVVNKTITIELNGHNLTVKEDTEGNGVFHVLEGGDLTIDGDGIIDGVGKNKWNLVIFAEAGKVTINGGTYTNVNTQVLEEDGDSDHFDVIYAKGTAQIEINGGTFEGITPEWLLNINDDCRETASITVKGGTFKGFDPSNNASEGVGTSFLAEGYKVVESNGEYTVEKAE